MEVAKAVSARSCALLVLAPRVGCSMGPFRVPNRDSESLVVNVGIFEHVLVAVCPLSHAVDGPFILSDSRSVIHVVWFTLCDPRVIRVV